MNVRLLDVIEKKSESFNSQKPTGHDLGDSVFLPPFFYITF